MKPMNNCNANVNADNKSINAKDKKEHPKFHIGVAPRSESWDPTPNTAEEMINTYGTYEIQATADTINTFPAISQGLPSEEIIHHPDHFDEGLVPKLQE